MKFPLVSYAHRWYRMHSIQGAVAIVVTCVIKAASLVILFPFLPWGWVAVIVVLAAILLAVGALKDQRFDAPKPSSNAGKTTQ